MSVRKAVIPIAGRGTRQLPASWAMPKAMIPVVDRDGLAKPLIHLLVAEAFSAGVESICLVVSPGQQPEIERYFRPFDDDLLAAVRDKPGLLAISDQLAEWGPKINYIDSEPEGFGFAVWRAMDWVGDEPFVLLLGDHVLVSNQEDTCTQQLVEVFNRHKPAAVSGMFLCDADTLPRVGVIRGEPVAESPGLFRAKQIVEKPSLDQARAELVTPGLPPGRWWCRRRRRWLAHFGNHVFSAAIMEELDAMVRHDLRERGEIQMTAAQERLRASGAPYLALLIDGHAHDAGIPTGWIEAQRALLP